MGNKVDIYSLPQFAVEELSSGKWASFLKSAAWNFRFPFQAQMLIYAQRPEATSCYSFDEWNNRFSRRIKRGAKGIVLLNDSKDQLSLDYVFDYSDTYSRKGEKLTPWELTERKESAVRDSLIREFLSDVPEAEELSPYQFVQSAVYSLLDDELETTLPDLFDVRSTCRLNELDNALVEGTIRSMIVNSATAMIMHRCGWAYENEQPESAFAGAEYLNSLPAMTVLGNAVQHISKQILREIAITVAKYDKEHINEEEIQNETGHNISSGRGVSDSEPDTSGTTGNEQIREDEEEIPERESGEPVLNPASVRGIDETSASDRKDDSGAGGQSNEGLDSEEPATAESDGEPSLDTAHGDDTPTSGRDSVSGDDFRLNYHFSEMQITEAVLRGNRVEGGKFRIQKAVEDNVSDFAGMLRGEYGIGGGTLLLSDGTEGFIDYDAKGIHLSANGYESLKLTWSMVSTRVRDLVNKDMYLSEEEKVQSVRYFEERAALHKRQELGETIKVLANALRSELEGNSYFVILEHIRAFVYENSLTARNELLTALGEFAFLPEVQNNEEVNSLHSAVVRSLADKVDYPEEQFTPSATDAGIKNPFPTEEELDAVDEQQAQPLDREPIEEPLSNTESFADFFNRLHTGSEEKTIALFPVGDFYEVYGADAVAIAPIFDYKLTQKTVDGETYTLCGFPKFLHEQNIEKLKQAGFDVAIVSEDRKTCTIERSEEETRAGKNYRWLEEYAPYILDGTLDYVRFESDSFEPLYIERIAPNEIAIAHTFVQNGDVMLDPEITFMFDNATRTLRPLTYEQSDMGFYQRVYPQDDWEHLHPNVTIEENINSFFTAWAQNLKWQGHTPVIGYRRTESQEIEFAFEDGKPVPKLEAGREAPEHNPEPLVDHPELVTDSHFPPSREDKDLLSDLMMFVGNYRTTFKLHMPELSEHDREGYDIATEYINNFVVTDEIYVNADLIRNLTNYINAWFVPFSEGVNPEITEKLDSLLERVASFDADALYNEQLQQQQTQEVSSNPNEEKEEEEVIPLTSDMSEEVEGEYNETSFHVGDLYVDENGRGIITHVYIPEKGVPHESAFGYIDPDAPEDSRDAKGYVMSMTAAIRRLNRGEATLTPANEITPASKPSNEQSHEPTLFDFLNDSDGPADPFNTPSEAHRAPEEVRADQNDVTSDERINFTFPEAVESLGGPKARFRSNVEAIRLLKRIEAEERLATPEEQEVLAKYVGWGGIQEAFDPSITAWSSEYEELKSLLTEDEYRAASESTMTAFYTPPEVSDAVFQVLGNLGFKRGNVLDPGCGIGSFSGRMPESMQESKVYGVEQDSISGRIAQQLYQKNNILIEGYEKTSLPDNFFDVAVGNVPFGDFKLRDKRYDKLNLRIHDYFFAKTLDKVRPGGVIAFVTSMGTMDKQSTEFRRYLAQRADLLGAIRLPNNTFKTNAGTDVTSDIIFLQKREFPRIGEAEWVELDNTYNYETGEWGPEVNAYFAANPDMILGDMTEVSGPHGPTLTCVAKDGENLREALKVAADKITGDYVQAEKGLYDQEFDNNERIPADPDVRNYSFTLVDDEVYFREDSEMYKPNLSATAEQRVRGLIRLRERVRNLIDAQMEGYQDEAIASLQKLLNDDYDAFTKKYGLINSRGNSMAFSDDSSYYLLCSLEHVNDKGEFLGKADMFYKRTIRAHEKVESVDTAEEALAVSLGERGRIDFEFMTELSGLNKEELTSKLQGHIFRDPTNPDTFELAATYLSGNVRRKLAQARAAEDEEPGMWTANISALENVQPQDLEPGEITVRLGSTWIPKEDYTKFMYELLNTSKWCQERGIMEVQYSPYTNVWNIKNVTYDDYNPRAIATYGTRRMSAYRILEHSLNLKDVKIYDTVTDPDGRERRVLNQNDTMEAQEKQQLIKDAFKEWIWQDPERADRLCKAYNEQFNSYVPPKFDGNLVQFHNLNPNVSMRPWQKEAIARIMYNGNTLLAHAVGAGKTWTMSAAAMEMKHLGLCNKSLIVVPNHLVGQWASAIYDQYPNAKVLASTKKDFETKNRKKFCSRIATGDYDVVIIGHSQFERIPLSVERQEAGIQAEIDNIVDAIAELKANDAEHFTVKQMERMKKSLETRLDKLHNSKKRDDVITFEELGIDRLFVDESHEYKNLFLYTKMQNVAGISQTDSQKASDMFLKCRYLDEITGNKGNIHATGTPLSNTMAELYATQRYLQYDLLQDMGLGTFDQWASTFGETVTSVELAPEGTGYRARTRFSNFFNIPELMSLYCQCADIKTQDMLDLPLPTPHYENVVVPASDIQKDYVKNLGERAQKIRNGGVSPEEDNMLKITSDGRKNGLDQRLNDPSLPDNPQSKVNACADNIFRIWQEHSATKGTQLVFCDISTPNNKTFNVYDDLKAKLMERGIPEDEIKFVHEANTDVQKEALFQKVRDGEVRVLLGSTSKMGTGTNVQERLVAGHDLDCPWRPSDLEQRAGRVIRQGNTNDDVYMYRYVTEGTFDAYMYQLVENKQRFISQIYTSKPAVRQAADVDEIVMSFAEIKALASGNPLIKERVELEADIQRLQLLQSRHDNAQHRLNRQIAKELPEGIAKEKSRVAALETDCAFIKNQPSRTADGKLLPAEVKGHVFEKASDSGAALLNAVKRAPENEVTVVGKLRGFTIAVDKTETTWAGKIIPVFKLYAASNRKYSVDISDSEVGVITRLNNVLDKDIPNALKEHEEELANLQHQLEVAKTELGKPFAKADELREKQARLAEVSLLLDLDAKKETTEEEPEHTVQAESEHGRKPSLDSIICSAEARKAVQAAQENAHESIIDGHSHA